MVRSCIQCKALYVRISQLKSNLITHAAVIVILGAAVIGSVDIRCIVYCTYVNESTTRDKEMKKGGALYGVILGAAVIGSVDTRCIVYCTYVNESTTRDKEMKKGGALYGVELCMALFWALR